MLRVYGDLDSSRLPVESKEWKDRYCMHRVYGDIDSSRLHVDTIDRYSVCLESKEI